MFRGVLRFRGETGESASFARAVSPRVSPGREPPRRVRGCAPDTTTPGDRGTLAGDRSSGAVRAGGSPAANAEGVARDRPRYSGRSGRPSVRAASRRSAPVVAAGRWESRPAPGTRARSGRRLPRQLHGDRSDVRSRPRHGPRVETEARGRRSCRAVQRLHRGDGPGSGAAQGGLRPIAASSSSRTAQAVAGRSPCMQRRLHGRCRVAVRTPRMS